MFRKIILSVALSAAALVGLAVTPPAADAAPPAYRYRHPDRFEVRYRDHGYWNSYGTYANRYDAERAARHLRVRYFAVRIEREWR